MFPIEYEAKPTPQPITVRAFEVDVVKNAQGQEDLVKSDRQRTVTVPYIADYYATKNTVFPFAYLLRLSDPVVKNLLQAHGIKLEKLTQTTRLEVESFKIVSLKPTSRLNQGHYTNSVSGTMVKDTLDFLPGTYVIRMAQPLANLAAYLLEPQSNDALLLWNFFDRYLVPQWGRGYNEYPVYRLMQKTELKTLPLRVQ